MCLTQPTGFGASRFAARLTAFEIDRKVYTCALRAGSGMFAGLPFLSGDLCLVIVWTSSLDFLLWTFFSVQILLDL